ncbi:MAG: GNAT family N-acetyltransferase [Proteobacteria bacterium]|nr:GNAT family N-acetyltransferase [Pseudomonadota bacterium]
MNFVQADPSSADVLNNLLELYCHDMSEWLGLDADATGSFAGNYDAPTYWADGGSVFIAYVARRPIGFAIVQSATPFTGKANSLDLKEFFILRKHRRSGAGNAFAEHVWNTHPQQWLVRVYSVNRPAVPFWRKTIAAYTSGDFSEEVRSQADRDWIYFAFRSTSFRSPGLD